MHMENYVLGSKTARKLTLSPASGFARLIQMLCLMNRISILCATFFCHRSKIWKVLYNEETAHKFSDDDRLLFEQQNFLVAFFLRKVIPSEEPTDDAKQADKDGYLLKCAQHMMKVLQAGQVIQSLVILSSSSNAPTARDEAPTKHGHGTENIDAKMPEGKNLEAFKITEIIDTLISNHLLAEGAEREMEVRFGCSEERSSKAVSAGDDLPFFYDRLKRTEKWLKKYNEKEKKLKKKKRKEEHSRSSVQSKVMEGTSKVENAKNLDCTHRNQSAANRKVGEVAQKDMATAGTGDDPILVDQGKKESKRENNNVCKGSKMVGSDSEEESGDGGGILPELTMYVTKSVNGDGAKCAQKHPRETSQATSGATKRSRTK